MRTKTLLLTAALTVAAAATSMAQAVYSVNIVGYVNLAVPQGFSMIANQLNASPNNRVTSVLPAPPEQTEVYKFNGSSYSILSFLGGAWEGDDVDTMTLAPGEGVFINAPSAFTATLVGEVRTGNVQVPVAAGFSIVSSAIPQAGGIQSVLGFPPVENDEIYSWNGASFDVDSFLGGAWEGAGEGAEPTAAIGESFFVNNNSAARTWTRVFNVGP